MQLSEWFLSKFFVSNLKVDQGLHGLKACIYRQKKLSPPLKPSKGKAIFCGLINGRAVWINLIIDGLRNFTIGKKNSKIVHSSVRMLVLAKHEK